MMKKIFLAALMAMSLCSYSYAQDDDDDEYEEDSPRAVAESTAPAKSTSVSKSSKSEGGDAFMGVSLELLGLFHGDHDQIQRIGLVFRIAQNMELSAHVGLQIVGDSDGENQANEKVNGPEGGAKISLGAGFDYFIDLVLPVSLGGDMIFTHFGEENNQLDFDVMFGARAEIIKNFTINGKVGFDMAYRWWTGENNFDKKRLHPGENQTSEWGRIDFGIAARINFIWFFI